MTIEIPLTRGYVTIVDDEDADLAQRKWCSQPRRNNRVYAYRKEKKKTTLIHRIIIARMIGRPLECHEEVDHINGQPLDNRRCNLRICTHSQNMRNRKKNFKNKSGFKGVVRYRTNWSAWLTDEKPICFGTYPTALDAAIAYNHAARLHYGEFARYNDIPGWENIHPLTTKQIRAQQREQKRSAA